MAARVTGKCRINPITTISIVAVLLIISAFPAQSQIHWNRGWGAGGSMGKRSPNLPLINASKFHSQLSGECSTELFEAAASISQQLQREIENLLFCEVESRLNRAEGGSLVADERLSKILPLWGSTSKKLDDIK